MATIFYTSKSGSNGNGTSLALAKRTIQAGIALLSPGDTLYVDDDGTPYDESFDSTFMVGGNDETSRKVICGYPGKKPTIRPSNAPNRVWNFSYLNQRYITLQDFVIDAATCLDYGIQVTWQSGDGAANPAAFIRLLRLEVKNARNSGVVLGTNTMASSNGNEVLYCNIHDNGRASTDHGIYCQSRGNTIEGGEVHHHFGYGVHVFHQSSTDAQDNIVRYVRAHHNGQYGVLIGSGDNNYCYYCDSYLNFGGFRVEFNGTGNKLHNNTAYGNVGGSGVFVGSDVTSTQIKNCLLAKNTANLTDNGITSVQTTNRQTAGDGEMVDPVNGNFELLASSLNIDTGTDVGLVRDIVGRTVPGAAGVDKGAHEYHVPSPVSATPKEFNSFLVGTAINPLLGPVIASANTLAQSPDHLIHHISGTALIKTIPIPYPGFGGFCIFIPDAIFTWDATGNIALGGTAVVNRALYMVYERTLDRWYPSYVS